MIVLYLKENNIFLQAIQGFPVVKEENNKLLFENGKVIVNDLIKIGYEIYPDQKVEIPTEWNEETREYEDVPTLVDELNLTPMSAEYLPVSEHIGKLISVNPSLAKPAVVRRKFWGQTYDVNCLATQAVKDAFQAGDIQVSDFVLVSFIEEIPDTEERRIAIITDKVFESW